MDDMLIAYLKEKSEINSEGCWISKTYLMPNGYTRGTWLGKREYMHRLAVVARGEKLIKGLDVDHVCHTGSCREPCSHRACCNPEHVFQKTHAENQIRTLTLGADSGKVICDYGHDLTQPNAIQPRKGSYGNTCRLCNRERSMRSYYKKKGKDQ